VARVAVVGAGPGGIAAARRLKGRAGDEIVVTIFERESVVEYLPGTMRVFFGTPRDRWRQRLALGDVEVNIGEVEEISGSGVIVNGRFYKADAVVAAPGLVLDHGRVPDARNLHAFWDAAGAEAAASAVDRVEGGTVAVVVSSLPYRCPPAPFGMAMELAAYYREEGRDVRVVLTTPEVVPLSAVGGGVPEFLGESCAAAGVELVTGFEPKLAGLGEGRLLSTGNDAICYDVAFVVPPHGRSPLLTRLAGEGPLVQVSPLFESSEPGLFVVGDAAMTPLPRAADAAAAEGRTAADAVLERLDLFEVTGVHMPEPECYVGHGGGAYSKISLRYPNGLPPAGSAAVVLEGPSEKLAAGFEASFDRWRKLRGG